MQLHLVSSNANVLFNAVLRQAGFPLTFRRSKGESLPVTSVLAGLGVLWVFHDKGLMVLRLLSEHFVRDSIERLDYVADGTSPNANARSLGN